MRVGTGNRPPNSLSARSHMILKSCEYIRATMKLKLSSVSDIMTNKAVFSLMISSFFVLGLNFLYPPSLSSSSSSSLISSRTSVMSNGESLAPQDTNILLAVLPARNLTFLYCRNAKWFGARSSNASNREHKGTVLLCSLAKTNRSPLAYMHLIVYVE